MINSSVYTRANAVSIETWATSRSSKRRAPSRASSPGEVSTVQPCLFRPLPKSGPNNRLNGQP